MTEKLDNAGVIIAAIIVLIIVGGFVYALLWYNDQIEIRHNEERFYQCINLQLGNCPDYSEVGREECFQAAVKECKPILGVMP